MEHFPFQEPSFDFKSNFCKTAIFMLFVLEIRIKNNFIISYRQYPESCGHNRAKGIDSVSFSFQ